MRENVNERQKTKEIQIEIARHSRLSERTPCATPLSRESARLLARRQAALVTVVSYQAVCVRPVTCASASASAPRPSLAPAPATWSASPRAARSPRPPCPAPPPTSYVAGSSTGACASIRAASRSTSSIFGRVRRRRAEKRQDDAEVKRNFRGADVTQRDKHALYVTLSVTVCDIRRYRTRSGTVRGVVTRSIQAHA